MASMPKFFFSLGTDPKFPYEGGWIEVEAPSLGAAQAAYQEFHPNRENSSCINCAFMYSEREWVNTPMAIDNDCFGHACREKISVTFERIPAYDGETLKTKIINITCNRTIIDGE